MMPRFSSFPEMASVLGKRGFFWLGVASLAGICFSFVEYGTAFLLQAMLWRIGVLGQMPDGIEWASKALTEHGNLIFFSLVIMSILRALAQFLSVYASGWFSDIVQSQLTQKLINQLLFLRSSQRLTHSDVSSLMAEVFPRSGTFFNALANVVVGAIQVLVLTIASLRLCFWETVVGLGLMGSVAILIHRINAISSRSGVKIPDAAKAMNKSVYRIINNYLLIKVYNTEFVEAQKAQGATNSYFTFIRHWRFGNALSTVLPPMIGLFIIVSLVFFGVEILKTPSSVILIFLYLFLRIVQTFSQIAGHFNNASSLKNHWAVARSKLDLLFNAQVPERELSSQLPDRAPSVRANNVAFGYAGSTVVSGLNFVTEPGTFTCVIGRSGAGKTTLCATLLGLIKPSEGAIVWDPPQWSIPVGPRVAYVGPDPLLIEGSIRENLLYGLGVKAESMTDEVIQQALESVGLLSEISRLPNGLNYHLNELSEGLSTGQKQRLAIARALLRKPRLLILDEATANLDSETERIVVASLEKLKGRVTGLIVTHRPALLGIGDQTIAL